MLPPCSPKLNGVVDRAQRTHAEEFCEVTESSFDLSQLREELLEWEGVYNTVRPHLDEYKRLTNQTSACYYFNQSVVYSILIT